MIAAYIDEFIMFGAGLWMSGVGYGFLQGPSQPHASHQPWWAHLSGHFKWMGPLLLIISIVLAVASPS
ncbi:MAG: hypothetical protein E5W82_25180 [Mesorhizobium sp.]|nr:MAG: hypothetical protein E5W82_25180 [Mesorhizobium sp.]